MKKNLWFRFYQNDISIDMSLDPIKGNDRSPHRKDLTDSGKNVKNAFTLQPSIVTYLCRFTRDDWNHYLETAKAFCFINPPSVALYYVF